jgi:hypothetical protein
MTTPPIPVAAPPAAAAAETAATPPAVGGGKSKRLIKLAGLGIAALVVLGGVFFAWTRYTAVPPAPPPVAKKAPPPAAAQPAAPAPLTPSDALNAMAKAPVNAINKATDVVAARNASDQASADSIVDPANKVAVPKSVSTQALLSPGIAATAEVEAAAAATPAFRSFVANAKVSGVFQGSPSRALVNGRMAREGETVDSGLGIVFDGVDAERKLLIFKDKSGATVSRKY